VYPVRSISLKDSSRYYFDNTKIMGIVNNTPDSFFSGSRSASSEAAVERALKMIADGADIIDIGGESTRPGCDPITTEEEIERVLSVIEGIRKINKDILISVDTYRSETAEAAIIAGSDIINDISAMMFDEHMADVVKKYNVPVILMHIKGTPKNMQQNPQYENLMDEVTEFFNERIAYALSKGIDRDKLILDPGVGFGHLLYKIHPKTLTL
jgi:dihydropteroate synthase